MKNDIPGQFSHFCRLLDIADAQLLRGDFNAAAALAQVAARSAWPRHTGLFASSRLESILRQIGSSIVTTSSTTTAPRTKRRILHVLTYARPVGGDTRFVWRWITEDCNNTHSVVVTSQSHMAKVYTIPQELAEAVHRSGGTLSLLRTQPSHPINQAKELRALCQTADFVILHLFPYDIVPSLALAAECANVKTIFVNHSDHTFWVGGGVANVVANLRQQPTGFLSERRYLSDVPSCSLPIPLGQSRRQHSRAEAKQLLGINENAVVLLTVASPFKYLPRYGVDFLDYVMPVLKENTQATLIAVGPQSTDARWSAASNALSGRILPLGTRYDTCSLYDAADVYLDSMPFSSITSALEAGSRGVPLLGYAFPESEMRLLGPGAAGLQSTMYLARDEITYQQTLATFIKNPAQRAELGLRTEQQIRLYHTGHGWLSAVDRMYTQAEQCCTVHNYSTQKDHCQTRPLDLALLDLYRGDRGSSGSSLIRTYVGTLPYMTRLTVSRTLREADLPISLVALCPPPINILLQRLGKFLNQLRVTTLSPLRRPPGQQRTADIVKQVLHAAPFSTNR